MGVTLSAPLEELTSWRADWAGLRVAVLGLGMTGFSVADTLTELGASVLVAAASASEHNRELVPVIGAELVLDESPGGLVDPVAAFAPDVVVVSPGFHPDHPVLEWASATGVPVWGDIELAWRVRDKVLRADGSPMDWILVTGTNGKTTTTQLTATMLVQAGIKAAPAGNIGIPVLDAVRDPAGFDILVVELSSYQLHWSHRNPGGAMAPLASVVLNIDDDHLDWHGSRAAYEAAKARVYENTRIACVFNQADAATRRMVEDAEVQEGCRAIGFGLGMPGPSDLGLVEEILVDRAFLDDRRTSALELGTLADLVPAGLTAPHSIANVLAAAALARAAGAPPVAVREAVRGFRMDAHRTELVLEADGIRWVDDSKATNAHAANAALAAFESVVWIAGGLLKGVDPEPLVRTHATRLRGVVLVGADRSELRAAIERHAPGVPVVEVDATETDDVMPSAVRAAGEVAQPGDVVLLAPAAASMDQFTDYADRGRRFADAVRERHGGADGGQDAPGTPDRRQPDPEQPSVDEPGLGDADAGGDTAV